MRRCVWSRNIRIGAPYIYIYIYDISSLRVNDLTLILLTWKIRWAPNNASKWQMGFNSGFKGLTSALDRGWVVNATLHPGKGPGTKCTGGWVGPRAAGAKNIARTGIRYLAHSDRIESFYWLRYRGVTLENRYSMWDSYKAYNYTVWEKCRVSESYRHRVVGIAGVYTLNPSNPELNPICYLLALLGAHHFLHVSRIRVKLLTFRLLMSYIYIWSTHSWCF